MALSTDDLRAFLLVAQERSVTRAASYLGVTQQSVSERTRRLERRLGVQLFFRRPHGMQPTAAGYRFLPYAAQCVALLDQALAVISDDELMRVRVQSSASQAVLPILKSLAELMRIEISLGDDPDALLSHVADGRIEVAIGVFDVDIPSDAPPPGHLASANGDAGSATHHDEDVDLPVGTADIKVEPLFTDPIVWVVPHDHRLASSRTPMSLLELTSQSAAESGGSPGDAKAGLRVVARSIVADDLAAGRLVEVPVDQPGWVVPISIAYRASDHDRPAIAALRRAVAERNNLTGGSRPAAQARSGGGGAGP